MEKDEVLREVNLKCSVKTKKEPAKTLKEILKLYNNEQLSSYYYYIIGEEVEDTNKNLIDKIYQKLTSKDIIDKFLNILILEEYETLTQIVNNDGILQDDYIGHANYCCLRYFGIVHVFNYKNKIYVIIPKEILEIIKELDINNYKTQVEENDREVSLAYSMLNLYGVVPIGEYLEYYTKYYKHKTEDDINIATLNNPMRSNSIKTISTDNDLYFVKEEFLAENSNAAIINRIISRYEDDVFYIDFKDIKLNELLKYNDIFYYKETNSTKEFKKYLQEKYISDEEEVDSLIAALIQSFKEEYNESILFLNDTFSDSNIEIDETNIDEMLSYINKIFNDIPVWGNKGWSNKEVILGECYKDLY